MEVWKDIVGFEGLYQVSNMGRVKSLARDYVIGNRAIVHKGEQILKPKMDRGYYNIQLNYKGKATNMPVHRAVALAFIPNPLNKPQIDHINTIRNDNRVENLRWVTSRENHHNPISMERYKNREWVGGEENPLFEEKSPDAKVVLQYDKQGNLIARYACCHQAMRRNPGYNYSNIARACRGERYTYKGFVWRYEYKDMD